MESNTKKKIIIFSVIFVLLAGGGIATYFILRKKKPVVATGGGANTGGTTITETPEQKAARLATEQAAEAARLAAITPTHPTLDAATILYSVGVGIINPSNIILSDAQKAAIKALINANPSNYNAAQKRLVGL